MATSSGLTARLRDRRFYFIVALLTAALVFAGFARTFYLNGFFAKLRLPSLFIVHGVVFSSWLIVLVTQSVLISAKQVRTHQRLGYAGIAIFAGMVVLGWIMSLDAARRGFTPPGGPPPLAFLGFQLLGLLIFTGIIASGFLYRNRPETHKRLMIAGTVTLLTPAIARIFLLFSTNMIIFRSFGVQLAILIGCMVYDYVTRKQVHRAYIWSTLAFVAWIPTSILIGNTRAWLAVAHKIAGV
jgi:hypothetical protein